jgi:hypothetical protein
MNAFPAALCFVALLATSCAMPPTPKPPVAPGWESVPNTPAECHVGASMRFGGADHVLWEGEENREEIVNEALAEQASVDLACPRERITVAPPRGGFARHVDGCGRMVVYTEVTRFGITREPLDGRVPCTNLTTYRFLRLDVEPQAALAKLDADYTGPQEPTIFARARPLYSDAAQAVTEWTSLVAQGARDLECPRDRIDPGHWPGRTLVPVAEGCGKRATYLPGRASELTIQSIVAMSGR